MFPNILYSLPYFLLATVLFGLYIQERKYKREGHKTTILSIIAFIILLFFIGLRGHIYTDFIVYYPFYEKVTPIFEANVSEHYFEPGFIIYTKIIKTIIPNYFGWIFINTFIDLLALRYVFKHYCNSTILPFIFFIAFQGIMMEANLIRNTKALDCFFFSIPYLINRKFIKYLLLNILGFTFHTSAILFIPLYFVLTKNLSIIFIWISFVVVSIIYWFNLHFTSSLISYFLFDGGASERVEAYLSQGQSFGFTFGYFERTATFILFTLLRHRLIDAKRTNIVFYNCAFWYYICHIFFDDVAILAERIPFLFIIGYWVLYPNVTICKYPMRRIVNLMICIIVSMKIILSYSSIGTKYQNILFGVDSYEKRNSEVFEDYINFQNTRLQ